jgi:hypothetical protein
MPRMIRFLQMPDSLIRVFLAAQHLADWPQKDIDADRRHSLLVAIRVAVFDRHSSVPRKYIENHFVMCGNVFRKHT